MPPLRELVSVRLVIDLFTHNCETTIRAGLSGPPGTRPRTTFSNKHFHFSKREVRNVINQLRVLATLLRRRRQRVINFEVLVFPRAPRTGLEQREEAEGLERYICRKVKFH